MVDFFVSNPAESAAIPCLWGPHPVSQQTSPGKIFSHSQALLNILSSQRPCLYQHSKSFRKYNLSDVSHTKYCWQANRLRIPRQTHWLCININSSARRTGPVAFLLDGVLFVLPLSCKCVGPYRHFKNKHWQTLERWHRFQLHRKFLNDSVSSNTPQSYMKQELNAAVVYNFKISHLLFCLEPKQSRCSPLFQLRK